MEERFQAWSNLHFIMLALTTAIIIPLIYIARKEQHRQLAQRIGRILAIVLILNTIVYIVYRVHAGYWEIRYDLPMEFCNWSMIVTVLALYSYNRTMAELSYYWVMTGTIHAIITPDLQVTFPHIYFFIFFIAHSGLVIASLYLVFGLKLYPRKGSIPRTILYSQLYFISAFLIDKLLNSNYGYMMAKPASGSFMDFLGEWPYYLLQLQIIGIGFFIILYLPFYLKNGNQENRFNSTISGRLDGV